jgi:prepilin-type N-terminal cleavage/methylation domain-containing protein
MFLKKQLKLNKGFSLVEILIGSSIICVSLILIVNLETGISKMGFNSMKRVQAQMLAEEGVTSIRNIRNSSWQNISVLNNDVPYRLYWDQIINTWTATTSVVLIDNSFDRTVTFSAVNRDVATFDVVSSGGVVDNDTRKFVVDVSWLDTNGTSTRSISSYIYNIFNK